MKMSITKSGRLRKPSITLWCNWIIKAWDQIDPAAIIKSFKVCSISNALDGSEDSILYEGQDTSEGSGKLVSVSLKKKQQLYIIIPGVKITLNFIKFNKFLNHI